MDNFNIKVSKEAKENLTNLLKKNPVYTCIRIDYIPSCKGGGFNLFLDEFKENYIIENIDNLFFMYSDFLLSKASCIDIIFKDGTFMIKGVSKNKNLNSCKNCCDLKKCKDSTYENCSNGCSYCLNKDNCNKK